MWFPKSQMGRMNKTFLENVRDKNNNMGNINTEEFEKARNAKLEERKKRVDAAYDTIIWTSANGEKTLVKNLEHSHVLNIILLLLQNANKANVVGIRSTVIFGCLWRRLEECEGGKVCLHNHVWRSHVE